MIKPESAFQRDAPVSSVSSRIQASREEMWCRKEDTGSGPRWMVPGGQVTGFFLTSFQLLHKLHLQAFGYVLQCLFSYSESYRTTLPCMGFIS